MLVRDRTTVAIAQHYDIVEEKAEIPITTKPNSVMVTKVYRKYVNRQHNYKI